MSSLPSPPPPGNGAPLFRAIARARVEDFRVDECLAFSPGAGEHPQGEHLWLRIEKRLLDTDEVVALLRRVYEVGSADVGLSGLKDRRAVARQWFSVRTPRDAEPLRAALRDEVLGKEALGQEALGQEAGREPLDARTTGDGGATLRLLAAVRHPRKLRRGTHVANRFVITLRDVVWLDTPSASTALAARLAALTARGFPNYLGPQRFGRDGQNVARALAWFRRPSRRVGRLQRGLWLSAARSELFNRVCAARVRTDRWCELLPGEPVVLDGSRSFFMPDAVARTGDESLDTRFARGDVHPSAPWWGRGEPLARDVCLAFESDVLADCEALRDGLERAGLTQARRALRVLPRALEVEHGGECDERTLTLSFELPPGAFASTLLGELGDCRVAHGGGWRRG